MTDERHLGEPAAADATAEAAEAVADDASLDKEQKRKRMRAKMTLRIPDDELDQPPPPPPPAAVGDATKRPSVPEPPRSDPKGPPIQATPIINVGIPSDVPPPTEEVEAVNVPAPLPSAPLPPDDSWTPFQPTAADAAEADADSIDVAIEDEPATAPTPEVAPVHAPVAAAAPPAVTSDDMVPDSESEPLELDEVEAATVLSSRPPAVAHTAPPLRVPPPPPVPSLTPASGMPAASALAPTTPASGAPAIKGGSSRPPPPPDASPTLVSVTDVSSHPPPPPEPVEAKSPSAPAPKISSVPPPPAVEAHPSRPPAPALLDDTETVASAVAPPQRPKSASEEAELAAEDLVSVESIPGAALTKPAAPPAPAASKPNPPVGPPASAPSSGPSPSTPRIIVPTAGPSPLAPPPVSDSAPKRKGRLWWEELFGDDFIRTMAKITDEQIAAEVDFIEDSLGVAKGGTMLDLACGTGRHAIEFSRRGYQVAGFDLSLAMLARAADEAQERDQKLNFVQGDMREMTFENTFDGIYCWNTSFGFFEEEKNALVIGKVHRALKQGGQFLLDVVNRDFIINQSPSLVWFEGDGCVCMDEMQMDWVTSRMKVKRTMMLDDGRTKEIEYSIRVYSLHELGKLMHDQGFRIAEVSGRTATPGVFFGAASPRTLILAEKKG